MLFRRILLLQQPLGADVTEAQVAVVALRGRDNELITEFSWLPHGEPMDAISLAEQLVPNTRNKLHLFATGQVGRLDFGDRRGQLESGR